MDRAGDERGTWHVAARKGPEMERREIQRLAWHTSSLFSGTDVAICVRVNTHIYTHARAHDHQSPCIQEEISDEEKN